MSKGEDDNPEYPESPPSDDSCSNGGSHRTKRRLLLKTVAGGGAAALAGCMGLYKVPEEKEYVGLSDSGEQGGETGTDTETESPSGDESDDDSSDGDETTEASMFDVEFLREDTTLEISEDENILDVGLDKGLELPYQCRSGVCGQCKAQTQGDANEVVDLEGNQYLDEDQIANGYLLTCVGQPKADFALDSHPDESGSVWEEETTEAGTEETTEENTEQADVTTYEVEFLQNDATLDIPEDESILDVGLDEGLDLPYQCRHGVCGQCKGYTEKDVREVVEMDGNQALSDDEIDDGYLLTCVGHPRNDFAFQERP